MAEGKYQGNNRAIATRMTGTLEKNTHLQGREGAGTKKLRGPAAKGGTLPTNETNSGGINRATQPKS